MVQFNLIKRCAIPVIAVFALVIAGCSAFGSQDSAGVPVAQVTSIESEGTALRSTLEAQGTQVAGTAVAAETYVMEVERINQQLLATMRAAIPPTQQIVQADVQGTPGLNEVPGMMESSASGGSVPIPGETGGGGGTGLTSFTGVTTARSVNDSDGCAAGTQTVFTAENTQIYVSARALNITAGTVMNAVWSLNGSVVYDLDSFTVAADDDDFCLWFFIDPSDVPFTPGTWSVQLLADGQAVGAVSFTIE